MLKIEYDFRSSFGYIELGCICITTTNFIQDMLALLHEHESLANNCFHFKLVSVEN